MRPQMRYASSHLLAAAPPLFSSAFPSSVEVDAELFVKKASMVPPWYAPEPNPNHCRGTVPGELEYYVVPT